MQARWITLSMLIAAATPFAFAHTDQGGPGTPDFTCQTQAEWQVHDYAGANGRTVADISDNNLEECGTTYGLFIAGTPECRELEDRAGAGPGHPAWELLCNTDRPADYDGDLEFALGGGLLAVEDGDGQTSGSIVCLGTLGHHSSDISVQDEVFGSNVAFTVGADASLIPPPPGEPDCGDNVTRPCGPPNSGLGPEVDFVLTLLQTGNCNPNDHRVTCVGACTVPFGPGAEGTYIVWVHPTTNGGPGGTPTGASHGHIQSGSGGPTPGGGGIPGLGDDGFSLAVGGGVMVFDGGSGAPGVISTPGWSCAGPFNLGGGWEIQCSPDLILAGAARAPAECTDPFAVAGGTPVSSGTASVEVFCRSGASATCSTTWVGAGACVARPPAGSDDFPLHCRAQVLGTVIGGTLFAACGNHV